MIAPALVVAILLSNAAVASDSPFPSGYWDQGYATMNVQSENLTVALKVKELERAVTEVSRRMTKADVRVGNPGMYYGFQRGTKSKSLSYIVPAGKAEATAKSLFSLGDLQQYNIQKPQQLNTQLEEIEKKLKKVQDELAENADALKRMPISSYFLTAQRDRLTQARDAYKAGLNTARIDVTLTEASAEAR